MNNSSPHIVFLWYYDLCCQIRCNLIGVMHLDFALAYDELSPSIVQPCFGSSSRYHVGWDEKKKVISLSNHVIFVLFMPRCWENIWKRIFNEENDNVLFFTWFSKLHSGWFKRKLKTQQVMGDIILCCESCRVGLPCIAKLGCLFINACHLTLILPRPPRGFPLVALQRQNILPNASMIIVSSSFVVILP